VIDHRSKILHPTSVEPAMRSPSPTHGALGGAGRQRARRGSTHRRPAPAHGSIRAWRCRGQAAPAPVGARSWSCVRPFRRWT